MTPSTADPSPQPATTETDSRIGSASNADPSPGSLYLFDRSNRGRICLLGEDRHRFLNGQVTNNIRDLKPHQGCYTLITTNKGIIQGDATVYCLPDELLLDMEPETASALRQRLEDHIVADDVEIVDVAELFGLFSLQGSLALEMLKALLSGPGLDEFSTNDCSIIEIETPRFGTCYVAQSAPPELMRYDIFVSAESRDELWTALQQETAHRNGTIGGSDLLERLRIEFGHPRYPIDMTPSILAPELGIEDQTISYSKGCYIGQEVINRIRSVGRVNRRFVGLRLDISHTKAKLHGAAILSEGKKIGFLTSETFSPTLREHIALGFVKVAFGEPGTAVQIQPNEADTLISGAVAALPFEARSQS